QPLGRSLARTSGPMCRVPRTSESISHLATRGLTPGTDGGDRTQGCPSAGEVVRGLVVVHGFPGRSPRESRPCQPRPASYMRSPASFRSRGRPAVCDSGSARESSEHFVMTRPAIVVQHHVLHLFGYHGDLRVSPSKLLNGSNRLPLRYD